MSDTFAKSSNAPSFWETVRNGSNDEMLSNIGVVIEEYIEPTPGQSMFEQRVAVQNLKNLPRGGTTNTLSEHDTLQQQTDKNVAAAAVAAPKNKRKFDDCTGDVDYDSLDDFDFGTDGFESSSSSEYSVESGGGGRRRHGSSEEDDDAANVSVDGKKLNTQQPKTHLAESTTPPNQQQKNQQPPTAPASPPQQPTIKPTDILQTVQNVDLYDIPTLPILPYHPNKKLKISTNFNSEHPILLKKNVSGVGPQCELLYNENVFLNVDNGVKFKQQSNMISAARHSQSRQQDNDKKLPRFKTSENFKPDQKTPDVVGGSGGGGSIFSDEDNLLNNNQNLKFKTGKALKDEQTSDSEYIFLTAPIGLDVWDILSVDAAIFCLIKPVSATKLFLLSLMQRAMFGVIFLKYPNKGKLAYVTSVTSCLTIINNVTDDIIANISNDLDPLGYRTKIMILINSVSAFRLIMSDDENGGSQKILNENERPSAFIMDTPRQHAHQQQPQQPRPPPQQTPEHQTMFNENYNNHYNNNNNQHIYKQAQISPFTRMIPSAQHPTLNKKIRLSTNILDNQPILISASLRRGSEYQNANTKFNFQ